MPLTPELWVLRAGLGSDLRCWFVHAGDDIADIGLAIGRSAVYFES